MGWRRWTFFELPEEFVRTITLISVKRVGRMGFGGEIYEKLAMFACVPAFSVVFLSRPCEQAVTKGNDYAAFSGVAG